MNENLFDEVRSRDDRRGGDKKFMKDKDFRQFVGERVSVIKSVSKFSVKERIFVSKIQSVRIVLSKSDINVVDGKDVELLEVRKRKFEVFLEVSLEKKKIFLKGIIFSSKDK